MNWFTRLFHRPHPLLGQRVHAWHYSKWGREQIEGEVVSATEREFVLDTSRNGEHRAFVSVWQHDARLVGEELPEDVTDRSEVMGT